MAAPAAASPHIHARVHGARLHGRVLRTLRMNDIATDNYVDHRECEKRARTGGAVDGVAFGPGVVDWDMIVGNTRDRDSHLSLLSDAACATRFVGALSSRARRPRHITQSHHWRRQSPDSSDLICASTALSSQRLHSTCQQRELEDACLSGCNFHARQRPSSKKSPPPSQAPLH